MNGHVANEAGKAFHCPAILFGPQYREPGTAETVLAELAARDPESAGVMRAFLLYYRGDRAGAVREAEALLTPDCRFETTLGASHILSLEALYLGDTARWNAARDRIVKCEYASGEEYVLKALFLAGLDGALFAKDAFPRWLCEGCFDAVPAESYGVARYLYAKYLYMERRFSDLAAAVEPMISQSYMEKALLSEIYLRIIAAMGRYCTGENDRAKRHLRRALACALPDGLLAPFAEYRRQLGPLLDETLRDVDAAALKTVIGLNDVILAGWTKLYNALYDKKYTNDLTAREYDAARFALLDMNNAEIAGKMGISVNTVKLHLRNVYEKLGISRRDELGPYIWEDR